MARSMRSTALLVALVVLAVFTAGDKFAAARNISPYEALESIPADIY